MRPPNSNNPQKHQLQYLSSMPFPVLPSKHFGWAFTLRPPGNLIKGLLKRTASNWQLRASHALRIFSCRVLRSEMVQLHAMISVCCKKWLHATIYLYHPPISTIYLSIYAHLSVSTYLYMSIPNILYPCLMCADCADHGTHFPAHGHVLLGDLGWALGSRPSWSHHTTYLYNMIHLSN